MSSKRQREHAAAKAAKLRQGKPVKSKYAAKGGPYGYDLPTAKPKPERERR